VTVDANWLNDEELAAWVRLAAVLELLPGELDSQLRRDAELTHFDYYTLAMLSEAPQRTLRMTSLATQTNATLPRLSHVVNVRLTPAGWDKVRRTAPGHVANVRQHVIDALTPEQVRQLAGITEAILGRLDPDGTMVSMYHRYDPDPAGGDPGGA